jgi:UDP:flavonoid glycosyltransferase YjiC (YdhE family)
MKRFRQKEAAYLSTVVEALNGMNVDAVVTMSGGNDRLHGVTPAKHVRVERYVPHDFLLDRARVMVTHGGWGAVGRALRFGVPMLVIPFDWDQPTNAKMCEQARVGVRLTIERLDVGAVRERLAVLLAPNSKQTRAARGFAQKIRKMRPTERAADHVLALLKGAAR